MKRLRNIDSDLVSGAVMVAVGLYIAWSSIGLHIGTPQKPGAGFFPLLMGLGIAFAAGTVVVARVTGDWSVSSPRESSSVWRVLLAVSLLFTYVGLLNYMGFLLATALVLIAFSRWIQGMSWRAALAIVVPAVLACTLLFRSLGVPLPAGVLLL